MDKNKTAKALWDSLNPGDSVDIDILNTAFAHLGVKSGYNNIESTKTMWIAEMAVQGFGWLLIHNDGFSTMIEDKDDDADWDKLVERIHRKSDSDELCYGDATNYPDVKENIDKMLDDLVVDDEDTD